VFRVSDTVRLQLVHPEVLRGTTRGNTTGTEWEAHAGPLAEAWRGGPQHRLSQLLKGCRIEPMSETQARDVGSLIGQGGLVDIVDVAVVEGAARRGDAIVTTNRSHIEQVAGVTGTSIPIHDV